MVEVVQNGTETVSAGTWQLMVVYSVVASDNNFFNLGFCQFAAMFLKSVHLQVIIQICDDERKGKSAMSVSDAIIVLLN